MPRKYTRKRKTPPSTLTTDPIAAAMRPMVQQLVREGIAEAIAEMLEDWVEKNTPQTVASDAA